ncbi:cytochrome P450/oxidoreductase [Kineosporia succinea]|uniref:Cytochrome P450/ferredoxin-NADP reductase n=1 Tax=Kineosporia succinea TaxID=84632 RepID=A0ABT9P778_9ACTN|nr:cytochrome P450 [Kineosporia succinea]MDP9828543.1 cytochrome P450/ferredoxin-NADP reductase [Kineosporia succinea]
MASPSGHPHVFDHHSDRANADPRAYYAQFRTACPVGRTPAHGGYVYTSTYADVVRVARDDATFSSSREADPDGEGTVIVIPRGAGLEQFPIELDPPRSTPYRDLVDPLLSPDAVARLRPMIARHTARVIDAFIERGSADLVKDLTNPLPAAVTLYWLGFPEADWALLAGPIHDIFAARAGSERAARGAAGLGVMDQRIRSLVRARRVEPHDDAVSVLVRARRPDGSPFTDDELVSVIGLLVAGGVDTTTSLTGSTLVHLARHPAQRARLIAEPDLLRGATEEFLRAFSPSQSMARTATTDTSIGGCPVSHGERVLVAWVAANHDPVVFPDPDTVDLDRDARRHVSFGIGTHRCAGAHLARAMFTEMITQVLTRLGDWTVDEDGLEEYPTKGNQTGWDAIPARFSPGPRVAVPNSTLVVESTHEIAEEIVSVTFTAPGGGSLPDWEPGAHLEIVLPSGQLRQYSLCGDPTDRARYRIAVLREDDGRGGSLELHHIAVPGLEVGFRPPRNHFPLLPADRYLFLAGGIGMTPLLPMIRAVAASGTPFEVVYGGRRRATMAFVPELEPLGPLTVVPYDEVGHPDFPHRLAGTPPGTAVYACGSPSMLAAVESACTAVGLELHTERFTAPGDPGEPGDLSNLGDPATNTPFEVVLHRTGTRLSVPAGLRLIEVVRQARPNLAYDCESGYCGACETRVLAGVPEHRDSLLTDTERASGRTMMICISRCAEGPLVLDL